ncbi:MAG TPA: Vms1/Ankzf1 family peptidyl-tRNA hydrolase [Streptosporangiales bacterium]
MSLEFLKPVYARKGPYASVVLETNREAVDDAAHAIDLRWRGLRTDLASAGADEPTLEALDAVVGRPSHEGGEQGQVVIAESGDVLLDERVYRHPGSSVAHWGPIPDVMPILRSRTTQLSYLVVRADSRGADVEVRGPARDYDVEVEGAERPLHKVREGGWSHRKIQQRAENTARQNAKLVAEQVNDLAGKTRAELVVLAGDPHAVSDVFDELGKGTRELVKELHTGSRHSGAEPVDTEVAELVADHVRATDDDLLDTFRAERGGGERAADGLDATVESLRESRVDTLFVEDDGTEDRESGIRLWVGRSDPLALARRPGDLEAMGVGDGFQAAAVPAIVRAAAGSDARLALVEPGALGGDGIAALLRY